MNVGNICSGVRSALERSFQWRPLSTLMMGCSLVLLGCDPGSPADSGSLTGVAFSSAEGQPLALSPAFAPDIHDYTLRCAQGTNALTLTASVGTAGTVSLASPTALPIPGGLPIALQLNEDQAVVLNVSAPDGQLAQYWFRCLPHDFPTLAVAMHRDAGQPTPGWYLMGNSVVASGESGFAMILDGNGTPVWYSRSPGGALNVERLANNTVTYFEETLAQYRVRHLDTGQVSTVGAVGLPTDVHELQQLPSGNYLLLSYPPLTGIDLTGLQSYGSDSAILDCVIQEVDPSGALKWQWRASDHIDPVQESTYPTMLTANGQSLIDVYHCNSIEADGNGDLLVSARHLDSVFFIAKQTGKIVWKLGGARYSKDGAQLLTMLDAPNAAFFRQHDARFLADGGISLFDDQTAMPAPAVARGAEYRLDFAAGTAQLTMQYPGPTSSLAMGSFRHYEDGSRVVCWGAPSTGLLAVSEFDAAGANLLDISFGGQDYSYRGLKVPVSSFDLNVLRQAVGQP